MWGNRLERHVLQSWFCDFIVFDFPVVFYPANVVSIWITIRMGLLTFFFLILFFKFQGYLEGGINYPNDDPDGPIMFIWYLSRWNWSYSGNFDKCHFWTDFDRIVFIFVCFFQMTKTRGGNLGNIVIWYWKKWHDML